MATTMGSHERVIHGDACLQLVSLSANGFSKSAGNETLGFRRIEYINLPYQYYYADAVILQSIISNIMLVHDYGVDDKKSTDADLAPTSLKR